ncbi:MAG: SAM-dependent methyltransferase [Dorea sp.]|nr:SAM-dependent methyltransferase [Dorea sp.]
MRLPKEFEEKMRELLKEEFPDYMACYGKPPFYGLRVNTGKITAEEFERICPFPIHPVPWIGNGYYYDGESVTPSKHPYYYAGLYYLQEPSAMTPASRLPVEPGDKVLDVCAAPGGKATELGARLGREGLLVANDLSSSRAKGLLKNIEVFGIGNVLVLSEEPGKLCDHFPEYFDKILIDAPCSGEGMFRKDKKMVKAWEEHGPEFFSNIQRGIILKAARMLKPGGMLLYSTCTFDARENEQVIGHLLAACPEFCVMPMEGYEGFLEGRPELSDPVCRGLKETVRIFPHRMDGEGHYLALLKKKGTAGKPVPARERSGRGKEKLPEELKEFLEEVSVSFDSGRMDIRGERVYYMPQELPDVRGIRFLRTGLLLGELKKKRFEPSQALAMYLKKEEYRKTIDFGAADERIFRYLKGETLEVSDLAGKAEKGWYLVCVDSYPLGWGKLSKGTLKNKYLPGWRLC